MALIGTCDPSRPGQDSHFPGTRAGKLHCGRGAGHCPDVDSRLRQTGPHGTGPTRRPTHGPDRGRTYGNELTASPSSKCPAVELISGAHSSRAVFRPVTAAGSRVPEARQAVGPRAMTPVIEGLFGMLRLPLPDWLGIVALCLFARRDVPGRGVRSHAGRRRKMC